MLEKNIWPLKCFLKKSIQNLLSVSVIIIMMSSLLNINPSTLLLLNSINNIVYNFLCKNKSSLYLIPNLIFISPVSMLLLSKYKYEYILCGFIFYSLCFFLLSFLIKKYSFFWLNFFFPPIVIGLIIIVMGLDLSIISIEKLSINNWKSLFLFLFTFLITIFSSIVWNDFVFIPVFIGIIFGYTLALTLGLVNLTKLYEIPWFYLPKIYFPKFNLEVFFIILPVIFLSLIEYISFLVITEKINFKNKIDKKNILFKSILINGIINTILSFLGSIPSIFHSESIKLLSRNELKNKNNNLIIYITSIIFIILSFIGKIHILIKLIPIQVILGISLFVYGTILCSGIRILINSNIDFNNFDNTLLISVILITGIIFKIVYKNIKIKGLILSILVGIILNLLFKIINYIKFKF